MFVWKKMKCSWNRCKDGGCSDIVGAAGDLASVKALGREHRVKRLPERVMQRQEKLDCDAQNCQHTQEHRIHWTLYFALFSSCTLARYVVCDVSIFENMGIGKKKKKKKSQIHCHNALQGIVSTQTKNSPQPPSHSPLILSCPNCGRSHPRFTSSGRERGRELWLWLRTDHPVFP